MTPMDATLDAATESRPAPGMEQPDAEYDVQVSRLVEARGLPWMRRTLSRIGAHCVVRSMGTMARAAAFVRQAFGLHATSAGSLRIVLTGGFTSHNWIAAHVGPLATAAGCEHVWVVSDRPFDRLKNVTYSCPPGWLARLVGRVAARSLWFVIVALKQRATVVGGFHLLCNGLLAHLLGSVTGATAVYFCVGGWAEILGGGAYSGHRLFGRTGRHDRSLEEALLEAIRDCDLTITMGTRARAFLAGRGATRVLTIPGGIPDVPFGPSRPFVQRDLDLVLVARLDPIKRVDRFLEVVREVARRIPTVTAAVVGDGPLQPTLREVAVRLGVADRVMFAGFQQDVGAWLARARILVLTSDSEGLPLSTMEAMAAGLPVVVSRVGDVADLVRDGDNGYTVSPRDVHAFAQRIVKLLDDPASWARMAASAAATGEEVRIGSARRRWQEAFLLLRSARAEQAATRQ